MVFAAGKERDFRLYLVTLAEQHSSELRATLVRHAATKAKGLTQSLQRSINLTKFSRLSEPERKDTTAELARFARFASARARARIVSALSVVSTC